MRIISNGLEKCHKNKLQLKKYASLRRTKLSTPATPSDETRLTQVKLSQQQKHQGRSLHACHAICFQYHSPRKGFLVTYCMLFGGVLTGGEVDGGLVYGGADKGGCLVS